MVSVVVQTSNSCFRIFVLTNTSKNIVYKAYRHSPSDLGDDHRQVDICTTLEKTQVVKKELKPRSANCLHTTKFILLCIFSLVGTISLKTGRDHNPGTRNDHFRFPSVTQKRHLLTKLSRKQDILRSLKRVILALFFDTTNAVTGKAWKIRSSNSRLSCIKIIYIGPNPSSSQFAW